MVHGTMWMNKKRKYIFIYVNGVGLKHFHKLYLFKAIYLQWVALLPFALKLWYLCAWCWFKAHVTSFIYFKAIYLPWTVLPPTALSFDLCEWCWIKALVTSFIYLNAIYLLWLELPPSALIYLLYLSFVTMSIYRTWSSLIRSEPAVSWSSSYKMIGPEVPSYKRIWHEVPWSWRSWHEVPRWVP